MEDLVPMGPHCSDQFPELPYQLAVPSCFYNPTAKLLETAILDVCLAGRNKSFKEIPPS